MNDVLLLAVLQSLDAGDVDTARGLSDLAGDDAAIETLLSDDVAESVQGPKGPPPFPGAVFDTSRHRWVKGPGGGDPLASMKRRELQKVAMQVGAKTSLKLDEPVDQLKASILAHTSPSDTAGTGDTATPTKPGKTGFVPSLTPEQKTAARERIIAATNRPRSDPNTDPAGDLSKITPERLAEVSGPLVAAVKANQDRVSVGPSLDKLYADVGEPTGLTPDEFRGAVMNLQKHGRIKLSGWSKTLDELPRPDLSPVLAHTTMGYAHMPLGYGNS